MRRPAFLSPGEPRFANRPNMIGNGIRASGRRSVYFEGTPLFAAPRKYLRFRTAIVGQLAPPSAPTETVRKRCDDGGQCPLI